MQQTKYKETLIGKLQKIGSFVLRIWSKVYNISKQPKLMVEVTIKVSVPDHAEKAFRKVVEETAKFFNRRERFFELMNELKGTLKADKSWKELKIEVYEQDLP